MAFETQVRYMARFTLPDGEHLAAGYTTPIAARAKRDLNFALRVHNPEVGHDPEKDLMLGVTEAQIDAAVAEIRAKYPDRPLPEEYADDGEAIRVLTNPEIVPGSKLGQTLQEL